MKKQRPLIFKWELFDSCQSSSGKDKATEFNYPENVSQAWSSENIKLKLNNCINQNGRSWSFIWFLHKQMINSKAHFVWLPEMFISLFQKRSSIVINGIIIDCVTLCRNPVCLPHNEKPPMQWVRLPVGQTRVSILKLPSGATSSCWVDLGSH